MQLEILTHVGVGPLRFGMTVDEVRSILPAIPETFLKGADSVHPTDAFDSLGLHVFYRVTGNCEAIELSSPASPTLQGKALLDRFHVVEQLIRRLDNQVEVDASGLTSIGLGLAIYCPGHEEDATLPVQGILVFEQGYYDAT